MKARISFGLMILCGSAIVRAEELDEVRITGVVTSVIVSSQYSTVTSFAPGQFITGWYSLANLDVQAPEEVDVEATGTQVVYHASPGISGYNFNVPEYSLQVGPIALFSNPQLVGKPDLFLFDGVNGSPDILTIHDYDVQLPSPQGGFGFIDDLYITFTDPTGTAFNASDPGDIDLSKFVVGKFDAQGPMGALSVEGTIVGQRVSVPEPDTLALLLAGFGLVAVMNRSRSSRRENQKGGWGLYSGCKPRLLTSPRAAPPSPHETHDAPPL